MLIQEKVPKSDSVHKQAVVLNKANSVLRQLEMHTVPQTKDHTVHKTRSTYLNRLQITSINSPLQTLKVQCKVPLLLLWRETEVPYYCVSALSDNLHNVVTSAHFLRTHSHRFI